MRSPLKIVGENKDNSNSFNWIRTHLVAELTDDFVEPVGLLSKVLGLE